jgi:hypothetical protein
VRHSRLAAPCSSGLGRAPRGGSLRRLDRCGRALNATKRGPAEVAHELSGLSLASAYRAQNRSFATLAGGFAQVEGSAGGMRKPAARLRIDERGSVGVAKLLAVRKRALTLWATLHGQRLTLLAHGFQVFSRSRMHDFFRVQTRWHTRTARPANRSPPGSTSYPLTKPLRPGSNPGNAQAPLDGSASASGLSQPASLPA